MCGKFLSLGKRKLKFQLFFLLNEAAVSRAHAHGWWRSRHGAWSMPQTPKWGAPTGGSQQKGRSLGFIPFLFRQMVAPSPHHTRGLAGALLQSGILKLRNAGCQGPKMENHLWPPLSRQSRGPLPECCGPCGAALQVGRRAA